MLLINDYIDATESLEELYHRSKAWAFGDTGIPAIDSVTRGKLAGGEIFEIRDKDEEYGRSVLYELLCLTVSPSASENTHGIRGKQMKALYINTGRKFMHRRFFERLGSYFPPNADGQLRQALRRLDILETYGDAHLELSMGPLLARLADAHDKYVVFYDHASAPSDAALKALSRATSANQHLLVFLSKQKPREKTSTYELTAERGELPKFHFARTARGDIDPAHPPEEVAYALNP